jgi:hypothetical protein
MKNTKNLYKDECSSCGESICNLHNAIKEFISSLIKATI